MHITSSYSHVHFLIFFQVHVLPREIMGVSTFGLSLWLLTHLSIQKVDQILLVLTQLVLGDTARLGIPRPNIGPMELKRVSGKTPVLDVGTIAKIKSGDIKVINLFFSFRHCCGYITILITHPHSFVSIANLLGVSSNSKFSRAWGSVY
jgi:hypothetical protein